MLSGDCIAKSMPALPPCCVVDPLVCLLFDERFVNVLHCTSATSQNTRPHALYGVGELGTRREAPLTKVVDTVTPLTPGA